MKSGQVRDEILDAIAYNNAPSCKVLLKSDSEKGEFLSDGEQTFKVGYNSKVQFNLNAEKYVFKTFEAVSKSDNTVSRADCVEFTNITSEAEANKGIYKINVKLIRKNNDIKIRPVCIEIPKLAGISPSLDSNGCNQDSKIIISFNKEMDINSFKDSNGEYTGISITTSDGENLSSYFDNPYFSADRKALIIQPLCIQDYSKFILSPNGTRNTLTIELTYAFIQVQDSDGLLFTTSGSYTYKINKNFSNQEKISVLIQNGNTDYGYFLSDGEKECTVGFGFDIQFTLNKDTYVFWGFEAVSRNNPEVSRANNVAFIEEEDDDNSGIYKAKVLVTKAAGDILIRPKCCMIDNCSVYIEGAHGKFNPGKGNYENRLRNNHSYNIGFEPDSDYEFLYWQIYDRAKSEDNEITNGMYITIEDPSNANTSYVLSTVPEDNNIKLTLRPVIAERPQILSYSPIYMAEGTFKYTSIQVMFDYDMDNSSIYYIQNENNDEVAELLASGILENDLLKVNINGEELVYGYKKGGDFFYKNISITDNETGENRNASFNAPVFETPRILTITSNKACELPNYSEVLVTLDRNFCYRMNDDNVITMAGSKKWIYQVNNGKDLTKPETSVCNISLENGAELIEKTAVSSTPWNSDELYYDNDLKLYFDIKINDTGIGPADEFTVNLKRVLNQNYTECNDNVHSLPVTFQNVKNSYAIYNKTIDFSDLCLEDGLYSINFIFKDKSNNELVYPGENKAYYFVYDKSPIESGKIKLDAGDDTGKFILSVVSSIPPDRKFSVVKYREKDSQSDYTTITMSENCELSLDAQKIYELTISHIDYAGNESAECNLTLSGDSITQAPVQLSDYIGTVSNGIYYKFGDFPQTIKDSSVTVSENPIYNNWYLGDDGYFYEKCVANPYIYGNINSNTPKDSISNYTCSDGTVLEKEMEYYFKVEPIKWRVLNPDENGNKILFAENILMGNIPFNSYFVDVRRNIGGNFIQQNNYKYSNVRAWLNGRYESDDVQDFTYENNGFLQTAFTESAQSKIKDTTIDNTARSTNPDSNASKFNNGTNVWACDSTIDKIFLLSEQEVTKSSFGFAEFTSSGLGNARIRQTTDYAKANYAYQNITEGLGGKWLLRSPYYGSASYSGGGSSYNIGQTVYMVPYNGSAGGGGGAYNPNYNGCTTSVDDLWNGIVPALSIQLP